ncbi:glycosyltransferase involved in cell wall biosynthesis [Sulfitobacter guttiformis]|uniref:Glycosyltransferase involved in cell wall biosynthesis n=1 Tax=Sulfitobacter guttiformis TaxID=74349 RepID=A0A420DPA8_9RHOB|nr:glycosyltransferase involved in cell wall biosynthesis [Sulfitobacter guttiformis]
MTKVYSIFERIGLGGGGKVRAIYRRMNALAEMAEFDPVILNLDHNPNQKLKFSQLQDGGIIASGVRNLTVPEACHAAALAAGIAPFEDFPHFDETQVSRSKTTYLQDGVLVMLDRTKHTTLGTITKRTVPNSAGEQRFTLIDGLVHQLKVHKGGGIIETTDYVSGRAVRWAKTHEGKFVIGRNLVTGTICRMERIFQQNIFEMIGWGDAVVFFDGVTSAYLSPVTKARRALFLHADHRGPNGKIVPRSKFLIENFKGEAIITSTGVHKAQIEADVTPAASVHVIPHYCERVSAPAQLRRHFVTVSRLDLVGKPIDECIEAFCRIMTEFPQVDYLIYGSGAGAAQLEAQIARLGCGGRVMLAGYTNAPLPVFQGALASVYPTTTEGFGLSILEALSNGCPVISYDVNYGPREMIESGRNGILVPRGDIAAIAEAMRRVLSTPERFQRETSGGLERYTREAYLNNYRNFVTTLAATPLAD